ncbi:hypothetical protein ScPMuIL_002077, partial [Solemya velum]
SQHHRGRVCFLYKNVGRERHGDVQRLPRVVQQLGCGSLRHGRRATTVVLFRKELGCLQEHHLRSRPGQTDVIRLQS